MRWHSVPSYPSFRRKRRPEGPTDLPTEAEWEYACRAGSRTEWCFEDDESVLGQYAWYRSDSAEWTGTHPVGLKKPNTWALYDMHGNVWEWCQDWYDAEYYTRVDAEDPPGPATGTDRVHRGGCWFLPASLCRSAFRIRSEPGFRLNDMGFRVAAVPSGQ